jgi:hypothetical protein
MPVPITTPTSATASGNTSAIDPPNDIFPHCLVWCPLPFLTWLFPFIGMCMCICAPNFPCSYTHPHKYTHTYPTPTKQATWALQATTVRHIYVSVSLPPSLSQLPISLIFVGGGAERVRGKSSGRGRHVIRSACGLARLDSG